MRRSIGPLGLVLALGGVATMSCSNPDASLTPEQVVPSSSASSAPAPVLPPPPAPPETLTLVPQFRAELPGDVRMAAIAGAVLVSSGQRVGRIDGDKIEWLGRIPSGTPGVGKNIISRIGGRWPDLVYALYSSSNGRAPMPSYWPIKGGGRKVEFSPGGGMGWIAGVAQVGESTLVSGYDVGKGGYHFERSRGPILERKQQTLEAEGCDLSKIPEFGRPPAVATTLFDAGLDGTLFSVGGYCYDQGVAAEIWPSKGGPSKIVRLDKWLKDVGFDARLLQGKSGTVWLDAQKGTPILEYTAGKFTALPRLKKPRVESFTSREGQLHASDGDTLHRYEGGQWKVAAHLDWRTRFDDITLQGDTYWAVTATTLYRLQKGKSVKLTDDCKTPFVYLYDVSYKSGPKFTFPATRKALASFGEVGKLGLVEFQVRGRRLGIQVPSAKVGEDVIAYLAIKMPKEAPLLVCYAPEKPRKIELSK